MQNRRFVGVAVTTLALMGTGGVATTAHAQYVAEFTPFFTSYYSLTKTGGEFTLSDGTLLLERQYAAPGLGARLTVWISRTLGVEASGQYVWSGTRFLPAVENATGSLAQTGTLITGTGRIVLRPARTNFHAFAGAGVVARGGAAWDYSDITKKKAVAGVVGFGARANITPKLALMLTVEGTFYSFNPDGSAGSAGSGYPNSKLQSDIHVTIGVPLGFGRR